jgi:hypothetical protein
MKTSFTFCILFFTISFKISAQNCYLDSLDGQKVWKVVDTPPKFGEISSDLSKYIVRNIRAVGNNPPSSIACAFIIDTLGKVRNPCLLRFTEDSSPEFIPYFLGFLQKMPRWQPAIKDGKKVYCIYSLPIRCLKWVR